MTEREDGKMSEGRLKAKRKQVSKSPQKARRVIAVTQADINAGAQRSMTSCPIALAAKRVFPGKDISVCDALYVGRTRWVLPERALDFIDDFDWSRLNVKPTRITVSRRKATQQPASAKSKK